MQKPSLKYLQKCVNRAHSADPRHVDVVITDLRKRMNRLAKYIAFKEGCTLSTPKPLNS